MIHPILSSAAFNFTNSSSLFSSVSVLESGGDHKKYESNAIQWPRTKLKLYTKLCCKFLLPKQNVHVFRWHEWLTCKPNVFNFCLVLERAEASSIHHRPWSENKFCSITNWFWAQNTTRMRRVLKWSFSITWGAACFTPILARVWLVPKGICSTSFTSGVRNTILAPKQVNDNKVSSFMFGAPALVMTRVLKSQITLHSVFKVAFLHLNLFAIMRNNIQWGAHTRTRTDFWRHPRIYWFWRGWASNTRGDNPAAARLV